MTITTIAFDGDDTLWHHENFFLEAKQRLHALLNRHGHYPDALERMDHQHIIELPVWGYGVKAHILSAIQAAIVMTDGKIPAQAIGEMLTIGRELYQHPLNLLEGVTETIGKLRDRYQLLLITKGDLVAQEMKIHKSGLSEFFDGIEIVSEKDTKTYQKIMRRYGVKPEQFVMVGNTLRSDIAPVIALGAQAIHIPYQTSWDFEKAEIAEIDREKFIMLPSIKDVPALLDRLEKSGQDKLSALVESA